MLKQRLIVGLIGLPAAIALIWLGGPWFSALVTIWGAVSVFEFYRLVARTKTKPLPYFGIIWTMLFTVSPYLKNELTIPVLLTSVIVLPLIILLLRRDKEQAFGSWVWTAAGILYIGWLSSYWIALRVSLEARDWVLMGFLATFATDTAAFFIGSKWGKHHLAPVVSPNKTWEGAVGGVAGGVVVALLFTLPTPIALPISYWQAISLGILVSIFGQLGDLVKSLFKRNMGVKDSSRLIPGHGGFLDRIDSIVFTGVVVYYFLYMISRHFTIISK